MSITQTSTQQLQRSASGTTVKNHARVQPSIPAPGSPSFTLDQDLKPFGQWVQKPIWVPPKDSSRALAESMWDKYGPFSAKEKRWEHVVKKHRAEFTQVREINLHKASIRLPKGRFFVSVTEREDFDTIAEPIPDCVKTRLEEFLAGPGKKRGVKVSYLKPLCVEVNDELILTKHSDLMTAIRQIQDEVFSEYRWLTAGRLPGQVARATANVALALPRAMIQQGIRRHQKKVEDYHAKLEFERRKTALRAAKTHRKYRTDGCTYDEILALTNPLETNDVIEQYGIEKKLSRAQRDQLMMMAAGTLPWFVALSIGVIYASTMVGSTAAVAATDPVFVAEMPDRPGQLLNIGHFDEVGGIMHVEI